VLGAASVVLLTLVRVDWSLFLFLGLVLVFDQHEIPGFYPFTLAVGYFKNLKENPVLPSMSAGVINPLEIHLILMIVTWFVALGIKRLRVQRPAMLGGALVFFLWILGSLIYGLRSGGDFLPALWEVRALAYLAVLYCFVPQVVQTKEQMRALMWVAIAAISIKALQGIYRFARLGFSYQGFATLTNHEDPVFIVTLVALVMGLILFRVRGAQRSALLVLLIPLLAGFVVGQRRAAYASGLISMASFIVVLPRSQQWTFLKAFFPIVGTLAIYCALMWESDSKWASPVRLIKSGLSTDKEMAGERFYSNLYREFEKYDLAVTVRNSPVVGIGFGKKYEQPIPLADISFPLKDYIPHNEILWLVTKMGGAGFLTFCLFINAFVLKASFVSSRLTDRYLQAKCAVIVAAVVNQIVVSYYDLQLTYYRNMVYLGCLMGMLPTLEWLSLQGKQTVDASRPNP
jgi:hypothetical protein